MKKLLFAMIGIFVFVYVASGSARAAEPAKTKTKPTVTVAPAPAAAKVEQKELTKEEMVTRLKEMLGYHPDLEKALPGLVVKEADGKKAFEYNGKKMEDLDKDKVSKLFMEANRFISFQNAERFQRQQKNLKQIDDINKMQRSFKQNNAPSAPKTYTQPKVYKTPGKY